MERVDHSDGDQASALLRVLRAGARRNPLSDYIEDSATRIIRHGEALAERIQDPLGRFDSRQMAEAGALLNYLRTTFQPWTARYAQESLIDIDILERGLLSAEKSIRVLERHLDAAELPERMTFDEVSSLRALEAIQSLPLRLIRSRHGGYYVDLPAGWTTAIPTLTGRLDGLIPPFEISQQRMRHYLPDFITTVSYLAVAPGAGAVPHYLRLRRDKKDLVATTRIAEVPSTPARTKGSVCDPSHERVTTDEMLEDGALIEVLPGIKSSDSIADTEYVAPHECEELFETGAGFEESPWQTPSMELVAGESREPAARPDEEKVTNVSEEPAGTAEPLAIEGDEDLRRFASRLLAQGRPSGFYPNRKVLLFECASRPVDLIHDCEAVYVFPTIERPTGRKESIPGVLLIRARDLVESTKTFPWLKRWIIQQTYDLLTFRTEGADFGRVANPLDVWHDLEASGRFVGQVQLNADGMVSFRSDPNATHISAYRPLFTVASGTATSVLEWCEVTTAERRKSLRRVKLRD